MRTNSTQFNKISFFKREPIRLALIKQLIQTGTN